MANPGPYPPMGGQMQQMGPPMGPMGPMGMAPRPQVRQGTSRVVPVVVSAGLAVGVFCGLLFGLGTGKQDAAAEPPKVSNGVQRVDEAYTPGQLNPGVKIPDKNAPAPGPSGGSAAAAGTGSAGSGAASDATGSAGTGSAGTGSAAPAEPPATLVVEIKPEAAGQAAKIFVDGEEITGATTEIAMDPGLTKKKVKVLVKTPGFKDVEQEIEVEGETTLKLELIKGRSPPPPAAGGATAPGPGSAGPSGNKGNSTGNKGTGVKRKPKGSGGLIDI